MEEIPMNHPDADPIAEAEVLKSCPFCGGEPEIKRKGNDHTKRRSTEIRCSSCHFGKAVGAIRYSLDWTEAQAIAAWNRRADDGAMDDDGINIAYMLGAHDAKGDLAKAEARGYRRGLEEAGTAVKARWQTVAGQHGSIDEMGEWTKGFLVGNSDALKAIYGLYAQAPTPWRRIPETVTPGVAPFDGERVLVLYNWEHWDEPLCRVGHYGKVSYTDKFAWFNGPPDYWMPLPPPPPEPERQTPQDEDQRGEGAEE